MVQLVDQALEAVGGAPCLRCGQRLAFDLGKDVCSAHNAEQSYYLQRFIVLYPQLAVDVNAAYLRSVNASGPGLNTTPFEYGDFPVYSASPSAQHASLPQQQAQGSPFICYGPGCQKPTFGSRTELEDHHVVNHPDAILCPFATCLSHCVDRVGFVNHAWDAHELDTFDHKAVERCEGCPLWFLGDDPDPIVAHKAMVTSSRPAWHGRDYWCPNSTCLRVFSHLNTLSSHHTKVHATSVCIPCRLQGKADLCKRIRVTDDGLLKPCGNCILTSAKLPGSPDKWLEACVNGTIPPGLENSHAFSHTATQPHDQVATSGPCKPCETRDIGTCGGTKTGPQGDRDVQACDVCMEAASFQDDEETAKLIIYHCRWGLPPYFQRFNKYRV